MTLCNSSNKFGLRSLTMAVTMAFTPWLLHIALTPFLLHLMRSNTGFVTKMNASSYMYILPQKRVSTCIVSLMSLHDLYRHNIYVDTWLEVSLSAIKRKKKWKFGCSCFWHYMILHFHEFHFNMLTATVETSLMSYDTFGACGNPILNFAW